jgi:hypothetical protein
MVKHLFFYQDNFGVKIAIFYKKSINVHLWFTVLKILFSRVFILLFFLTLFYDYSRSNNKTIIETVRTPSGFTRVPVEKFSFASWLRNLPVKPRGSSVLDYRGRIYKYGNDSTVALVIDWDISGNRMEQCMDILVHFYAKYLKQNNRESEISFPLPGGYWLAWQDWKEGWRPLFQGINMTMVRMAQYDSSGCSFNSFLNTIFAESHTQQFYHVCKAINRYDIQIGDFLVTKGSKSHAVMIIDLAVDAQGKMIALIGHGDTPACQFYLFNYQKNNPWFPLDFKNDYLPLPIRKKMNWNGLRRF